MPSLQVILLLLLLQGTSCYLIVSLTRFSLAYPVIEGTPYRASIAYFIKQTEGSITLRSINKVNHKFKRRLNPTEVYIVIGFRDYKSSVDMYS